MTRGIAKAIQVGSESGITGDVSVFKRVLHIALTYRY